MADVQNTWTSPEPDCSYTCVIKEKGCVNSYTGSKLKMDRNKIKGAQNEKSGWTETVCIKCTASSREIIQKDNLVFS